MLIRNTILAAGAAILLGVGAGPPASVLLAPEGEATANVLIAGLDTESRGPVIVLLVDEAPAAGGPDGKADRAFILQVRQGEIDALNRHVLSAEVSWSREAVHVRRAGVDLLTLALNGTEVEGIGTIRRGSGLAHTRAWEFALGRSLLKDSELDAVIASLKRKLDEGKCYCTAGGKKSTSCDIPTGACPGTPSGCGVGCQSGATPCCGCIWKNHPDSDPMEFGAACCMCGKKK